MVRLKVVVGLFSQLLYLFLRCFSGSPLIVTLVSTMFFTLFMKKSFSIFAISIGLVCRVPPDFSLVGGPGLVYPIMSLRVDHMVLGSPLLLLCQFSF